MLEAFLKGNIEMFNGVTTTFENRIKLFSKMDLIVIPAYLRVELEKYFKNIEDYEKIESLYNYFYLKRKN